MSELALSPSPAVVKTIVQNHKNVYTVPTNVPLADIGYKHEDLIALSAKLFKQFRVNITVRLNDDIISLSDKLYNKLKLTK